MKKHVSIIVSVLILLLLVSCIKSPPDASSTQPGSELKLGTASPLASPESIVQRESGEILLSDPAGSRYLAVDNTGVIYIGGSKGVYRIKEDNVPELLIDNLTWCVGLSVAGDSMFVLDARDELVMQTYDMQGKLKNEREIIFDAMPRNVRKLNVFQDIPVALIEFMLDPYTDPCLFNYETGQLEPLPSTLDYYGAQLSPLLGGRIIVNTISSDQRYELAVSEDLSVTVDITGKYGRGFGGSNIVHDRFTGKEYEVTSKEIRLIADKGSIYVAANPYGDLGYVSMCFNETLYLLTMGKLYVLRLSDISETRTLKVFGNRTIWNHYPYLDDYIKYFESMYPEIKITKIFSPEEGLDFYGQKVYLSILSGELEADVLMVGNGVKGAGRDKHRYGNAGVAMNLLTIPEIANLLDSPDLLDGVKENCLNPDGTAFGIPCGAYYDGYIVNAELFSYLDLVPPSAGWTVQEYYELAKAVSALRGSGNDVYLQAQNRLFTSNLQLPIYKIQNSLGASPVFAGANSSNGYNVRINSLEMIDYCIKGKEIFELYPFAEYDGALSGADRSSAICGPDMLLWPVDPYSIDYCLADECLSKPWIPLPSDVFGNSVSPFTDFMCIYAKSGNAGDAALFLAGFIDEGYQRSFADSLAIYKDFSKYENLLYPEVLEPFIAAQTKATITGYNEWIFGEDVRNSCWELEDRFFTGGLSAEAYVRELHNLVEKIMLG